MSKRRQSSAWLPAPLHLPSGWRSERLAEALQADAPVVYGILQPGPDTIGGVPYIRPTEIENDVIQTHRLRKTTPAIAGRYRRSEIRRGDVILSIVGTIGKVAIVPDGLDGANITQSSARLRADRTVVTPSYLAWALRSPVLRAQYDRHRLGTAVPRLNIAHVRDLTIPVAPPVEQPRIVAKIEELYSDLDAAVAALQRVRANLTRYRAAVLKAAIEGRLTEEWRKQHSTTEPADKLLARILAERRAKWEAEQLLTFKEAGKAPTKGWKDKYKPPAAEAPTGLPSLPVTWTWTLIDTIAPTATGGTPSRTRPDFFDGDIPWVKSGELGDSIVRGTEERLSEAGLNGSSAKVFPAGTLCIALYGATVGKVGILGIPAATNQAVCAIFLPPAVKTEFVFYYLMSIRDALVALGKGGAQPNISNGIVRATAIPLPPSAEQAEIVAEVDRRLSVADAAETQIEHALQRAKRLRQSILKRAFEGRLVHQDPHGDSVPKPAIGPSSAINGASTARSRHPCAYA